MTRCLFQVDLAMAETALEARQIEGMVGAEEATGHHTMEGARSELPLGLGSTVVPLLLPEGTEIAAVVGSEEDGRFTHSSSNS